MKPSRIKNPGSMPRLDPTLKAAAITWYEAREALKGPKAKARELGITPRQLDSILTVHKRHRGVNPL